MREFREVHVQDLATVFADHFRPEELVNAARRFEVDSGAIEALESDPASGFSELAATEELPAVIAYLIESGEWDADDESTLSAALEGSAYSVRQGPDGLELHKRVRGVADRTTTDKRAWMEAEAPGVIMTQIEAAESNLAAGDHDLAAAEIRRAMDMLVVGGFDEGLEEFAEEGLIQVGDEHQHSDATVLYVTYGYCSFLGGDPEVKGFRTSRLQAELAVTLGEEVLYFLLQKMAEAESEGVELRRWERP